MVKITNVDQVRNLKRPILARDIPPRLDDEQHPNTRDLTLRISCCGPGYAMQNDIKLLELLRADYRDLVIPQPDEYDAEPTALEAARMIAKGHPAKISSNAVSPMATTTKVEINWHDPATYIDISRDSLTDRENLYTIAITDDGLADSVRHLEDGRSTFVKPLEERMTMSTFLSQLTATTEKDVLYLQSQDGNIYRSSAAPGKEQPELQAFQRLIQPDLEWMHKAIGLPAEAVNLWIGSSKSTTSFHHDPYENIYHVLSGSKTFTLIAPIEGLWLSQAFYPSSTLVRTSSGELSPEMDDPPMMVPWIARLDVTHDVQAMQITVEQGETLYLPAEWWHRVDQQEGPGGIAVAVNYWYPAPLRPERFAYDRLARRIATVGGMNVIPPVDLDDDSSENGETERCELPVHAQWNAGAPL